MWTHAEEECVGGEEERERERERTHDALCGRVEFGSRSKYSIRDEISRRPSPCASDHNGLPALSRLLHATSAFAVLHLALSLSSSLSFPPSIALFSFCCSLAVILLIRSLLAFSLPLTLVRHSYLFSSSGSITEQGKSAASIEPKFIKERDASRATMTLIKLNLNRISRFRIISLHISVSNMIGTFVAMRNIDPRGTI